MLRNKKLNQKGFTIIEVLIVLAIAGLIMLIVFLAVPALQRNSRNTQRKNDVAGLGGAISEYVNNNGGQLPADDAAFESGVKTNVKLGYYDSATASTVYTKRTTAGAVGAPTNLDTVNVASYSKCQDATTSTATNATARSIVAVYLVETSGGTIAQCQEL